MATADLSSINYFLPLLGFLLVFIIIFVILKKTKLIENPYFEVFVSFLVATVFVSAAGSVDYVLNILPWFAILAVSLFLILALVGFSGKHEGLHKGIGIAFVILLILAFVVSAIVVYSSYIGPYLPGSPNQSGIAGWIYSPPVLGGLLLLVVSALVSWVLVKAK